MTRPPLTSLRVLLPHLRPYIGRAIAASVALLVAASNLACATASAAEAFSSFRASVALTANAWLTLSRPQGHFFCCFFCVGRETLGGESRLLQRKTGQVSVSV